VKYTLKDLEAEFRRLANDTGSPQLWTHDEFVRYANDTLVDAVERARLIEDDTTAALCRIPVKADKATYELDPRILSVIRARLASVSVTLEPTDVDSLDRGQRDWETTTGQPWAFIDHGNGKLRLVWTPKADDTLLITVRRLPLKPMVNPEDCPEIHPRFHYRLLDGILERAYMKFDSEKETYDPQKVQRHAAAFTAAFGAKIDANVQRKRRAHRPRVTRPNRYA
jgi:hypothetical protein